MNEEEVMMTKMSIKHFRECKKCTTLEEHFLNNMDKICDQWIDMRNEFLHLQKKDK
jgi:hypothetical protein